MTKVSMTNGASSSATARVVFKEIVRGDLRKFEAAAHDSDTGGGARDLRFRPYEKFAAIFSVLFPDRIQKNRRRGGKRVSTEVFGGRLYWNEGQRTMFAEAVFEPPTDVRGGEGRLTRVHTFPPLRKLPSPDGRFVLLLIQDDSGRVWPQIVTDTSLQNEEWNEAVAETILTCLNCEADRELARAGYIDLTTNTRFCNACVL